jgi:hypothetical protein
LTSLPVIPVAPESPISLEISLSSLVVYLLRLFFLYIYGDEICPSTVQ